MTVDPATTPHRHTHGGDTYYFCSGGCRTKFAADPERYVGLPAAAGARHAGRHDLHLPDASGDAAEGPGACPICGMALEPEMPTADAGPNPELVDMTRRFWIGARAHGAGGGARDGRTPVRLASALAARCRTGCSSSLATPVVLWAGWPFFVRGGQSLATRNLNMFTLIALGTGVAWIYSVVATVAPGPVSAGVPRPRRRGRGLFRGRRRDHRAGAARPGAGAARPRADLRRDPRAARSRAEDRASA